MKPLIIALCLVLCSCTATCLAFDNTTNFAYGKEAGYFVTYGTGLTFIGLRTGFNSNNVDNCTLIGDGLECRRDNDFQIGDKIMGSKLHVPTAVRNCIDIFTE